MRSPLEVSAMAMVLAIAAGCSPVHPADPAPEGDDPDADGGAEQADGAPPAEPDAGPTLVSTMSVSSDGSSFATPILERDRAYTIVASGEFTWGGCDMGTCPGGGACGYQRLADAFHRSDDCWTSTTTEFDVVSLYLDGAQVDWGPYRADHTYSIAVIGADASVQFRVGDCTDCFGDNVGALEVRIYDDAP